MADLVLVTGFGTGPRTARRVGAAFAEVHGGTCRAFSYGQAVSDMRALHRAVLDAEHSTGHSQGVELLLNARPNNLTAIAPPISSGRFRTVMRMPLAGADFARNPLELRRLEILASGMGEIITRGMAHSGAFLRGHLGSHMLHKLVKVAGEGTETTVVQMEGDEIISLLDDETMETLGEVRHRVLDGGHNRVLIEPHHVFEQIVKSEQAV
jgi:hypothetical protein